MVDQVGITTIQLPLLVDRFPFDRPLRGCSSISAAIISRRIDGAHRSARGQRTAAIARSLPASVSAISLQEPKPIRLSEIFTLRAGFEFRIMSEMKQEQLECPILRS
jgi:hypothetical protein